MSPGTLAVGTRVVSRCMCKRLCTGGIPLLKHLLQHLPRLRKPLGPSLRPPLARPGRTPVSWGRPGYTLGMGAAKAVRPLGLKAYLALEREAPVKHELWATQGKLPA